MRKINRLMFAMALMTMAGVVSIKAQEIAGVKINSGERVQFTEILPMPYPADQSGGGSFSIKPNEAKLYLVKIASGFRNWRLSFPHSSTEKTLEWEIYDERSNRTGYGTDAMKIEMAGIMRVKTIAGQVLEIPYSQGANVYVVLRCKSDKPCSNTISFLASKNKLELEQYHENTLEP